MELNNNRPVLPGCEFLIRKKGIQKLAYSTLLASQFNLDFISHLQERIQSMFVHGVNTEADIEQGVDNCGYDLDWNSINFENSLVAVKKYNSGNVMKIVKT